MSYPPPPQGPEQPYGYGYHPPRQPYWQPPPKIDPSRLRPARAWYWVAGAVAFVATVVAIVFVAQFVRELDPDIDNFRSNRPAEVEFNQGDRAIYVQTRLRGTPVRVPPADLRCNVTSLATGERVLLSRGGGSTLDVNSDSYAREFSFEAPRDGRYRVICVGRDDVRLAIGPDLTFGIFAPLIYAIASFVLGLVTAVAVAVVTAIRRSNHKRRLQREAAVSGPA